MKDFLLFAVCQGIALRVAWTLTHTPTTEVYVCFVVTAVLALIFDWPRPDWLGLSILTSEIHRLQANDFKHRVRKVSDLAQWSDVLHYTRALVRRKDTEELCDDVKTGLMSKAVIYGVVAIGTLILVAPHEGAPSTDDFIKAVLVCAVFLLVLIGDLSKCVHQYRLNRASRE